jgi:hypothetical protein
MQLVSPRFGTIEAAQTFLNAAQGAAATVSNGPLTPDTPKVLAEGARQAANAAAELFMAQPRSDFQDLVFARQLALEGKDLLEQAIVAYGQELPAPIAEENVQRLAREAFNIFEGVFEILEND